MILLMGIFIAALQEIPLKSEIEGHDTQNDVHLKPESLFSNPIIFGICLSIQLIMVNCWFGAR